MKKVLKVNPFFIEIIFVLLILTVLCGTFVKLFFAVGVLSRENRDKTRAMINARSKMELILSEKESASLTEYYDSGWNESENNSHYQLNTEITKENFSGGKIENIKITVINLENNSELCSFSSKKYLPGEVKNVT